MQKVADLIAVSENGNGPRLQGLPNKIIIESEFGAVNRRSRPEDVRQAEHGGGEAITLVINLIKAGIDPESITDLIIELKNKSLMGAR